MSNDHTSDGSVTSLSTSERTQLRRAWIKSSAVWRFVPGRGSPRHIRKWLSKQGPAEWHEIALAFNYDNNDWTPLTFIARQPLADRATIMSMLLSIDLPALEQQSQRSEAPGAHGQWPQVTELMDIIASGFANGLYQNARYQLGHAQSLLGATRTQLETIAGPLTWPLPDRAWDLVDGQKHRPEYLWDTNENCQRLPFEIWLAAKLRPN